MDLELNKTVNLFIALAPAATPKGFSHPLFDGFIKAAPTVIYSLLGRKVFLKPVLFWQSVFSPALFVKIIDAAVGFLFGWHCQNIDIEQKIVGYQHLFSLTSVKSIVVKKKAHLPFFPFIYTQFLFFVALVSNYWIR